MKKEKPRGYRELGQRIVLYPQETVGAVDRMRPAYSAYHLEEDSQLPVLTHKQSRLPPKEWKEALESGRAKVTLLGPPQSGDLPLRSLAQIVVMGQMLASCLNTDSLQHPEIWCPVHINAAVNNVDPDSNLETAHQYLKLATNYLQRVHSQLPEPVLVTDQKRGVSQLLELGNKAHNLVPSYIMDELVAMASNHQNGQEPDRGKITAYFLAHFAVYNWPHNNQTLVEVFSHNQDTTPIFLVPSSEKRFIDWLIDIANYEKNLKELLTLTSLDDNLWQLSAAVLTMLKHPPYYLQKGEDRLTLSAYKNTPFASSKIHQAHGLNGYVKKEVELALDMTLSDIMDNCEVRKKEAIEILQGIIP